MRTGNVSQLPSGRWSVRVSLPGGQRRRCRETFDTEAEARRVAAALVERYAEAHRTLAGYAPGWLDAREVAGARSIATWRSLWRTWIEPHRIAREPLRSLSPAMVRAWVAEIRQQRARQTAANALHMLRRMLAGAVDAGLLEANPAAAVRVPGGDARTVEPWTYLEPAEIDVVLRAAGDGADLVAFAIGTGPERLRERLGSDSGAIESAFIPRPHSLPSGSDQRRRESLPCPSSLPTSGAIRRAADRRLRRLP